MLTFPVTLFFPGFPLLNCVHTHFYIFSTLPIYIYVQYIFNSITEFALAELYFPPFHLIFISFQLQLIRPQRNASSTSSRARAKRDGVRFVCVYVVYVVYVCMRVYAGFYCAT